MAKSDLVFRSALELAQMLREGEVSSVEVTRAMLDRIAEVDPVVNAFLFVDEEGALKTAREVDEARADGEQLHPLAGVPIALKDNVVTRGVPTTAASRMLEGWVPPYDATIVEKIKAAKLPIVGKTNMDEFAMGSSTEHSAFGPTHNPWDLERIPGGSGGGSAAAVAAFMVPLAIGSDTGGSIRQPAAMTGTVGVKPTYGAVSRQGIIALGSSLDQAGPVARTVADAAALQDVIDGFDDRDAVSLDYAWPSMEEAALAPARAGDRPLEGVKLGVVKQLSGDAYEDDVVASFESTLEFLKGKGAQVVELDLPLLGIALDAYYVIMPAEASSNLAKFDGVRYGLRAEPEPPVTSERLIAASRGEGFGSEVKRRIIFGTRMLSKGFFDKYFVQAMRVRTLLQEELVEAFESVDVIVSPTSPTTAFKLGEKMDDPTLMYLSDITTTPANLGGMPAMSVPSGVAHGLPVGFQVTGPVRGDDVMYRVAAVVESQEDVAHKNPMIEGVDGAAHEGEDR
ncbi:Asp-tRNA(Asn)/Glu-tRNA(Gln) amidotransferase subunit GatA [Actinomyces sp.]|uniref:Asp-tRNA(Asn)/Glu-tRNA(Gln) amidotransferase subunit GatA n=1 Tax=Actinomyces sp. TaxID=29317 RepID=UPI00290EA957|nr:Asp-tRNA(Asn)/Glu-tRNA(Gln) amidotransferase subunit GatA [Actinomyces sp.]MDU5232117.1 Asp-tRNA(Asn)/Glu-tRNA(Gln) amidotransferase subunit GatA [Actinomyces sp.]MDU6757561.1 Asp-tRNA(Asn)/Glu-tRNA(Gln) amidotransferase subunit GatA [Actinomyces sp.]